MADHTPIFKPGREFTLTTSADVTGGKCLVISGQETVAHSGGASAAFVGIAAFDAKSGDIVGVTRGGVHELTASGTINDGDPIMTAASGAVAAHTGTTWSQVIGLALADAADNKVKALLY